MGSHESRRSPRTIIAISRSRPDRLTVDRRRATVDLVAQWPVRRIKTKARSNALVTLAGAENFNCETRLIKTIENVRAVDTDMVRLRKPPQARLRVRVGRILVSEGLIVVHGELQKCDPSCPQRASDLAQRRPIVRNVLEHMTADHEVETCRLERELCEIRGKHRPPQLNVDGDVTRRSDLYEALLNRWLGSDVQHTSGNRWCQASRVNADPEQPVTSERSTSWAPQFRSIPMPTTPSLTGEGPEAAATERALDAPAEITDLFASGHQSWGLRLLRIVPKFWCMRRVGYLALALALAALISAAVAESRKTEGIYLNSKGNAVRVTQSGDTTIPALGLAAALAGVGLLLLRRSRVIR